MQQKKEEPDPLLYHLPLSSVLNWKRWWHLIAKTVQLVLRKKTWAAIGSLLKLKKGDYSDGIVRLRKLWNRESLELKRIKHLSDAELECPVDIDMTEANMGHPTAGRRRRHKSPPTLHAPIALPVPRLDDHLDTENGPSDEEDKKEAKRQRSEPTTPISTSVDFPTNTTS